MGEKSIIALLVAQAAMAGFTGAAVARSEPELALGFAAIGVLLGAAIAVSAFRWSNRHDN